MFDKSGLVRAILACGAFRVAPDGKSFTLASGRQSSYYFDHWMTPDVPSTWKCVVGAFVAELTELGCERIVADRRIGFFAGAIGLAGGWPFNLVSYNGKHYDDPENWEMSGTVPSGCRVVLIGGTSTTGGDLLGVNTHGIVPRAVVVADAFVLFDRDEGAGVNTLADGEHPFTLHWLVNIHEFLDEIEKLPADTPGMLTPGQIVRFETTIATVTN